MSHADAFSGQVLPLGSWLLQASLFATLIAAMIFAIQSVAGRWLTPAWRYRLWGLVVLRLLLPPLPAGLLPIPNLHLIERLQDKFASVGGAPEARQAAVAPDSAGSSGVTVTVGYGALPAPDGATGSALGSPPAGAAHPSGTRWPIICAAVWLLVSFGLLGRLIAVNLLLNRRLKNATPVSDPEILVLLEECRASAGVVRPTPLLLTDEVGVPAAAGVWHARILLPPGLVKELSREDQRAILRHELAHIRCHDVAINWVLAILQIVHWFNPFIWMSFSRMRADREAARDAMVLGGISPDGGNVVADHYGRLLIKLTESISAFPHRAAAVVGVEGIVSPPSPILTGLLSAGSSLRRRLDLIAGYRRDSWGGAVIGSVLMVVVGAVVLSCGEAKRQLPAREEPAKAAASSSEQAVASPSNRFKEMSVREEKIPEGVPDKTLAQVSFDRAAFSDVIEFLRKASGANIVVKWPVLDAAGVDRDTPVSCGLHNVKLSFALKTILDGVGPKRVKLAYVERLGVITITSADELTALDKRFPDIQFDRSALSDVIDLLRDVSGANIFVNWKSLKTAGIDRTSPVTARLRNVKLSEALKIILDAVATGTAKLAYTIDEGVIEIATANEIGENVLTRVYDIRDLLAQATEPPLTTKPSDLELDVVSTRTERVKAITNLIEETVSPNSWKDRGGSWGQMRELQGQLIVTQTPENQAAVVVLLQQLHNANGLMLFVQARLVSCDAKTAARFSAEWANSHVVESWPAKTIRFEIPSEKTVESSETVYLLRDTQVHDLLHSTQTSAGARLVAAPQIALYQGQRAFINVLSKRPYVGDYKTIHTPDGHDRYEPAHDVVETGLFIDVQADVSVDRKFVTLALRPRTKTLVGLAEIPWTYRPVGSALTIQRPQMRATAAQAAVRIANGATVVMGGLEDPGVGNEADSPAATQPAEKPRVMFLLIKPMVIATGGAVGDENKRPVLPADGKK